MACLFLSIAWCLLGLLCATSPSNELRIPSREYLEKISAEFVEDLQMSLQEYETHEAAYGERTSLIASVRSRLDAITELSVIEMNQLIKAILSIRQRGLPRTSMHMAVSLLTLDHLDWMDNMPSLARISRMAKAVGMSQNQAMNSFSILAHLRGEQVNANLRLIDSAISDFIQNYPPRSIVPADLMFRMGQSRRRPNLPNCNGYEVSSFLTSSFLTATRGRIEIAVLILEGLEIFEESAKEDFSPEHRSLLSRVCSELLTSADRQDVRWEDETLARLKPVMVEELRPLTARKLQNARGEALLEALDSVSTAARIVLIPRLYKYVRKIFGDQQSDTEDDNIDKNLFEALVHGSVRVMTGGNTSGSLTALANMWDRWERETSKRNLNHIHMKESRVLNYSFGFASGFGIRLLHDFPHLLPGWSNRRIRAARQIMGTFLYFEGPIDWGSFSIATRIVNAHESRLERAVTILTVMFQSRLRDVTSTPLVNPGRWLSEFLTEEPATAKYAFWVHDIYLPRISLKYLQAYLREGGRSHDDQLGLRSIAFDSIELIQDPLIDHAIGEDHFQLPQRFRSMANRINSVPRLAGKEGGELTDFALALPERLLRWEVESGWLYECPWSPAARMIEEGALLYFDVIENISVGAGDADRIGSVKQVGRRFVKLTESISPPLRTSQLPAVVDDIQLLISQLMELKASTVPSADSR